MPTAPLPDRLDRLLNGLVARPRLRHAVLAVESGDRSFRWGGAAGEARPGGEALSPDTPFFLASIDKLFNATVAMKLSEGGELDLDATIGRYLPSALTRGLHRLDDTDYSVRITIRHLLGHTSGLPDWLEDRPKGGRSLVDRVLDEGDRALDIEDIASLVREMRPHFPPQDPFARRPKIRYSDTNFMLLIAVIEAVVGRPLHEVHDRLLLRPLDLRRTYFPGRSESLDPTPEGAALYAGGQPLQIPLLMRSIWGMYGTAGDALSFLRHLVRGEVFQEPGTLSSMQRHWNRFGFPFDRAALRAPSWPVEYGLGIMRFRLPRIFAPIRPLPPVIGHTGSTGCWLFYCPQWDLLLSGSVDEVTAGPIPFRVVPEILQIVRSSTDS